MSDSNDTAPGREETGNGHSDLAAAVTDFRNTLEAAWPSTEAQSQVVEAFGKYASILSEAWQSQETSQRASESYAAYSQSVKEAFQDRAARQRVLDAYRSFVDDLKRAWQDVDPSTLSPGHLASVAEGISWVAGVAGEISRAGDRMD